MKKSYICPISKIVEIDKDQILAGSLGFVDGETNVGEAKGYYFGLGEDELNFGSGEDELNFGLGDE